MIVVGAVLVGASGLFFCCTMLFCVVPWRKREDEERKDEKVVQKDETSALVAPLIGRVHVGETHPWKGAGYGRRDGPCRHWP